MISKTIQDINKLAAGLSTAEDLDYLRQIYNKTRDRINASQVQMIAIGRRVMFDAGNRGIIRGTLIGKNRKTWKIVADCRPGEFRAVTWRVTPHFVKLDKKAA